MSNEKEGKRLLADGPKTLAEFNPKMVERFKDRLCETCEMPIMGHWLIDSEDEDKRTSYWCDKTQTQASAGLKL